VEEKIQQNREDIAVMKALFKDFKEEFKDMKETLKEINGTIKRNNEIHVEFRNAVAQQANFNKRVNELEEMVQDLDKKIWRFGIIATAIAALSSAIGSAIISNMVDKFF